MGDDDEDEPGKSPQKHVDRGQHTDLPTSTTQQKDPQKVTHQTRRLTLRKEPVPIEESQIRLSSQSRIITNRSQSQKNQSATKMGRRRPAASP
jgi:hypothetical protein